MEAKVVSLEFDSDEKWGGRMELDDGEALMIDPMPKPNLPTELRAKRAE
ncbi:putative nitrogen fixation protein FixT [Magnetofaba australis IT-1]|uniref:Putative nitrogen fixation protein FixT n=1 Tax=Magnetofaba australis IT-1 TaxID=1434232 RepID=A0A1Y2K3U6_9PROT|nr:putative nitrogen fixation protein FixT [Magnetofaba australis IT-1]